jgi:hypothetical protein
MEVDNTQALMAFGIIVVRVYRSYETRVAMKALLIKSNGGRGIVRSMLKLLAEPVSKTVFILFKVPRASYPGWRGQTAVTLGSMVLTALASANALRWLGVVGVIVPVVMAIIAIWLHNYIDSRRVDNMMAGYGKPAKTSWWYKQVGLYEFGLCGAAYVAQLYIATGIGAIFGHRVIGLATGAILLYGLMKLHQMAERWAHSVNSAGSPPAMPYS